MIRVILQFLVRVLTGARLQCDPGVSLDPERPQLFFANHSSHLDALVLWSLLPRAKREVTRPVAAKDYWQKTGFRRYLARHVIRCVLVDRKPSSHEHHPLEPVWEALAKGDSLILFPEGSRNREEGIGTFKPGLFHIKERFPEVEMIPVHLSNLNRVMPKGECLPVPMICRVTMGAPFASVNDEGKADFLQRAREAVLTLGEKNDS